MTEDETQIKDRIDQAEIKLRIDQIIHTQAQLFIKTHLTYPNGKEATRPEDYETKFAKWAGARRLHNAVLDACRDLLTPGAQDIAKQLIQDGWRQGPHELIKAAQNLDRG